MNLVSLMDLTAAAGSLAAFLFILISSRRTPWKPEITLFAFIIILSVSHDAGNFLEWAGFTNLFDPLEDFLEVLTAALWAFFLYTFLQELTERKLKEIQELDEKILDSSPVAFVLRDARTKVLRVSKAFKKVTGYDPKMVLGKTTEEFMPDMPGRNELVSRIRKALESGEPVGPTEMQAPSPVPRHIRETIYPVADSGGNVTNTLSVLEDITEQRRSREALQESEKRYRMLFDSIHDGVVLHDMLDDGRPGLFLEVNHHFCSMTGYSRDELLRMTPGDIGDEMDGSELVAVRENLLKGRPTFFERNILTKDGVPVPCEFNSQSLFLGNRQVVLSVVRDITERKEAQDRIRDSLVEKETLLREIHHRVKNNLQVISGLLNLQSHYLDDEGVRAIFKESQNRIKTMALIHEELYQRKDLSRIDLADYITGLARNLMVSYAVDSDRINLKMDLQSVDVALDTAIPCGLIVNEIISNSLTHAFPDGKKGEIKIQLRCQEGEQYALTISDNGTGLPADLDIKKIRSLGLRLVTILSEQLGANLDVEVHEGTIFRLTFQEYLEAGTQMY